MDFGKDKAAHSPNELRLARESVEQDERIKQLETDNEKLSEQYDQLHIDFVATKRRLEADNKRLRESLEYIASCTSCWEEYVEQALKG